MTKREALNGKPYAGNPHVRFDEVEVASAATPRRGSLLYNQKRILVAIAVAGSVFAAWGAKISAERLALGHYRVFGGLTSNPRRPAAFKHGGIQVIHADGGVSLRLVETGREVSESADSKTVSIRMKDGHYPFEVTRHVKTWRDCGAVETWVDIRHGEPGAVRLIRADSTAMSLCMPNTAVRVMALAGSWCDEGNISEAIVANGHIVELASRSGTRNAWDVNSAMMVSFGEGVDEEHGKVLGVALEWTGTTCRRIRRRYDGKETEIFAGVDMTSGPYTLDPGVTFTTPRAILVWSEKGRGEVSRQYHRWARRHLMPHGDSLHPVLLNSWEGAAFGFTEKTLTDMMDGVAKMGGEMFVLDDGWFGIGKHARDEKNRDRVGLGDWCVNTNKLPHGLGWLADEAKRRGLQFGLWVEPEMANTRSDLATAHPDWLLAEANRRLICGRGGTQAVLDLTNGAVRDNLFGQLDTLYSSVPSLAYVKWDCNCDIHNLGSRNLAADRQPNLWYDYTMGLYEILARLKERHPGIMVQACAGGGGHMDFGFLRYADEFWTSDCTDPYKRIFIQWGASQFYPASAMACHVTASPNIATKRVTPIKYRFDVAMTGRLGFELHPKDMTADEIAFAKAAVADYKRIRPVVQRGDLYRLVSPYEKPLSALMYVGAERDAAVVFALGLKDFGEHAETLKLRGLNPVARYSVREINCGKRLHFADREDGGSVRTGRELMEKGIAVRLSGDYDSAVFELERLCADGARDEAQGTDSSSKRSGHADVACCVRFSSDSKSHLYKPGDRAVVEAMFVDKAGNALKQGVVELWADDGWTNRVWTRTIDLAKDSQPVRMELSRSTPGSLRIHAKGASIRERMDRILFGVDEIMPLTPCPDGFEEYWRSEQRRLEREVPIDARKEPAPDISTSDHDVFRVSFATFGGSRIYGLLAVPKGGGRFPAIVNVPGAGIGLCRFNKEIVRKGWITLMMNVHGFPMGATASEQKRNYDEWFKSYAKAAGEPRYQYVGYSVSRETPLYHRAMLGMARAIDYLAAEPYVDPTRFVYYGCSQGGGFGMYLTALWGKFAKSVFLCPNKCDMCAFVHGREPGSSHIKNQKPENVAAALEVAPWHDNCNFARMIKTPVGMMYGTADDNCQTVGGIAAFNCIASKDKRLRLLPGRGHGWHKADLERWLFNLGPTCTITSKKGTEQ